MSWQSTARAVAEERLIVVLRHIPMDTLPEVASALREGGVRVVEVALNSPDAIGQLQLLSRYDFCLGAGTALDEQSATTAIEAGAAFLFSPIRSSFFLSLCRRRDVLGIPGGLTPTEIYQLQREGAQFIKVFPGSLGGPQYIREILAPCENLRLIPAGGVTLQTLDAFLESGVAAVAVGTEIADPRLAASKNFEEIARRANQFTEGIRSFFKAQAGL